MNLRRVLKPELAALLSESTFIFGIRVLGAVLTFVTQLLLVRWMGAADLGKYVLTFSIASLVGFVSTLGMPVAAMRFVPQALAKGERGLVAGFLHSTIGVLIVSSCLCAAVMIALSFVLDLPPSGPSRETLIFGALLIPVFAALSGQNEIGRALFLMGSTFLPNMLLRHVFFLVGIAGLILLGVHLNAAWAMATLLVAAVLVAAGQFPFIRAQAAALIGDANPQRQTKTWLQVALPLVIVFGFTGYFLEINVAIAGAFLTSANLAVYSLSFQIANLIAFFLVAVGYQFAPHASRLYGEGNIDELQALISRTARVQLMFAFAMFGGLAIAGPVILGIFGPEFANGGYHALLILALSPIVAGLTGPVVVLQGIIGLERPAIFISAAAICLDLVLTPMLISRFGLIGAALAVLITMSFWNILLAVAIIRETPIDPTFLGLRARR